MANQGKNGIDVILAESLKELSKTRPIEKNYNQGNNG